MTTLVPRPGIMDITPYVGGESEVAGVRRVIKLASNEGALGPSPKAVAAYKGLAHEVHRYPDGGCTRLRGALAARHGMDAARIVCGAGSDELLGLLCRAYAGPGDEVLYSEHGFLMYPIAAKAAGATPIKAPETDLTTDVDALLAAVSERTKVLFLANPNNPTGTYLPAAEVKRLRDGLRGDILLVIDAAYAEFVTRSDYSDGRELVDGGENTVVCRTFSKIYALGGLRIGWAYGPPSIAGVLNRVRNPFNVAAPAQAAALAALEDTEHTERCRHHNGTWRPWTAEKVRALGLEVPDSLGNFILIRFPREEGRDAAAADRFLKGRGIITRRMVPYGLGDSLRVTIGMEDEMFAFLKALGDFMAVG